MSKLSKLSLALLLALPFLAGCTHLQNPSPSDTLTSPGTGTGNDLINPTNENSAGLEGRTDGIPDELMDRIRNDKLRPEDILVTVYFDFDVYNVRASERPALADAAKKLAADSSLHVVAVGHTDSYGTEQYNMALSEKRSNSAKTYMSANGANASVIDILALGKLNSTPDVSKDSPQAKHDRRVDIVKIPASAAH